MGRKPDSQASNDFWPNEQKPPRGDQEPTGPLGPPIVQSGGPMRWGLLGPPIVLQGVAEFAGIVRGNWKKPLAPERGLSIRDIHCSSGRAPIETGTGTPKEKRNQNPIRSGLNQKPWVILGPRRQLWQIMPPPFQAAKPALLSPLATQTI